MIDERAIELRWEAMRATLDERGRRRWCVAEARSHGRGGIAAVARALAVFLNGREIPHHDGDGKSTNGASFLLLLNAYHEPITFSLPRAPGRKWKLELATDPNDEQQHETRRAHVPVAARSIVVLSQR